MTYSRTVRQVSAEMPANEQIPPAARTAADIMQKKLKDDLFAALNVFSGTFVLRTMTAASILSRQYPANIPQIHPKYAAG